jgi:spore photoproduct lyase
MVKLYPEEAMFAGPLDERNGMVSYGRELEKDMESFCLEELRERVPKERLFAHAVEMPP